MTSLLSSIASLVGRRPRLATLAVLLSLTLLIGGAVAAGGAFKDDFTVPGIESQRAQDLLEQRFPAQSGTQATLVFSGDKLDRAAIDPALAKIADQPHVVSVDDLRVSEDGATAFATVGYDQTATELDASARERLEDATAGLEKSGVGVAMSGEPIDGAATGGFPVGELAGLLIAIVLLIAVLRNLRAKRAGSSTTHITAHASTTRPAWPTNGMPVTSRPEIDTSTMPAAVSAEWPAVALARRAASTGS